MSIITVRIVGASPLLLPRLWPMRHKPILPGMAVFPSQWPDQIACTAEHGGPGVPAVFIKHALVSAADQISQERKVKTK